jgi:glycine amidinotransferase/scyllo-inosamine-4-phosphate amidinotransferase 1
MILNSHNEWGTLKEVVVGTATGANWPLNDTVFSQESEKTTWRETPVPSGPVPQWIIDETNDDLEMLCDVLKSFDVRVHRPTDLDFVATDGMYNYCPRDRLIIAGSTVIDTAMMYPCRDQEIAALDFVVQAADRVLTMPRDQGLVLDAANVCRLDDTWLYLLSSSGNQAALDWLQTNVDVKIEPCNFYSGVHIDSTIVPVRPGLVVLNASRVNQYNCPEAFANWEKIWVHDVVPQDFYQYPYASKWIGLNMLSINPDTVIVDAAQTDLIQVLEKHKINVVPLTLRHSRTLGGGFHCVTLDLVRD